MQQVRSYWVGLGFKRQIAVVLSSLLILVTVLFLGRVATAPSMSLLYAGLQAPAAGEVVAALDQRGVPYEIRGEAIWVPTTRRDELRMSLAGEGLPATSGVGYELLDQLSGFGTTAQMFDAAHLRAKEGELARTIAASPFIRTARVHLAQPVPQAFRRDQRATASVTITSMSGTLSQSQAQAIRHLVASAVSGLSVNDVSVIDSVGGLIPAQSNAIGDVAEGRAAELKQNVERLLAARVGHGRALVEVSLDVETQREEISERKFDPQGRVAISMESESRSSSSSGVPPGVTVASNLPEGDAAGGEGNKSQGNESRERVNYEVSETAREILRVPGGVRRLSVAVLVDGVPDSAGLWQPRSAEEIADLRELVAAAVGYDEARGDMISIKSMQFEAMSPFGSESDAGIWGKLDLMTLIQIGVAAFVALALGLFVVRPVLAGRPALPAPLSLPPTEPAPALTGELEEGAVQPAGLAMLGETPVDPVERLRHLISQRQSETIEILRGWVDERGERE